MLRKRIIPILLLKDDELIAYSEMSIKINGENVYPEEIEKVIVAHKSIEECAVIRLTDKNGEALKAVIRLTPIVKASIEQMEKEIRRHLSESLSKVEVPKYIEFRSKDLPLTPLAKPDWNRLEKEEAEKRSADSKNNNDQNNKPKPPEVK